jgi:hypothetical protein
VSPCLALPLAQSALLLRPTLDPITLEHVFALALRINSMMINFYLVNPVQETVRHVGGQTINSASLANQDSSTTMWRTLVLTPLLVEMVSGIPQRNVMMPTWRMEMDVPRTVRLRMAGLVLEAQRLNLITALFLAMEVLGTMDFMSVEMETYLMEMDAIRYAGLSWDGTVSMETQRGLKIAMSSVEMEGTLELMNAMMETESI